MNLKSKIKHWMIGWFFKKPARNYINLAIKGKDEDFANYLHELLVKDEIRMVSSRDGLLGNHDMDIEINRVLQTELENYVRD